MHPIAVGIAKLGAETSGTLLRRVLEAHRDRHQPLVLALDVVDLEMLRAAGRLGRPRGLGDEEREACVVLM